MVTHPASSLAQDRESLPAETSVLTTMLRHQLQSSEHTIPQLFQPRMQKKPNSTVTNITIFQTEEMVKIMQYKFSQHYKRTVYIKWYFNMYITNVFPTAL